MTPVSDMNPQKVSNDSLVNQTFIIAIGTLCIVAGTVAAVFMFSSAEVQNVIAGSVIGTGMGGVVGFYFGSTKGSQSKDATIQAAVQQTSQQPQQNG